MGNTKFFIGMASFITILNAPIAFAQETKPCSNQAMFTPTAESIIAAAPSIAAAITAMQAQMLEASKKTPAPNVSLEKKIEKTLKEKAEATKEDKKIEEAKKLQEIAAITKAEKTKEVKAPRLKASSLSQQVEEYKDLTKGVIRSIVIEDTDNLDKMISNLEKATNLGIDMAKEVSVKEPEGAQLLGFLIKNIDKVKKESLDTIETNWHHGGEYTKAKIDFEHFPQDSSIMSVNDSVLHPITAMIALKQYKKDPDSAYLEQAQSELEEVLEHTKHIH